MHEKRETWRNVLRFGAAAAPLAIACGGLSPLWAVPAVALAALLDAAAGWQERKSGPLVDRLPKALLLLELGFLVPTAAAVAAMAPACWPDGGSFPLFPLTLLALGAAAAVLGPEPCERSAVVLGLGCALFFAATLFATTLQLRPSYDPGPPADALPVLACALTALVGRFLPARQRRGGGWFWVALGAFAVAALCAAFGKGTTLPLLRAVESISLPGFLQRFDALMSCALTVGLFLALSLLGCAAREIIRTLGKDSRYGAAVMAAAGVLVFFIEAIPVWFFVTGACLFWGLVPLLPLSMGGHGEEKKSLSKPEKKC